MHADAGRIPQSSSSDETGREISPTGHLFRGYPGSILRDRGRRTGTGRGNCRNLRELAGLKTPVLSIVTGEGGSGGALALAAGDQVWMLENSVYSILSPEGFASILWKDSTKAKEAAAVMKLTASDLYQKGIIE